MRALVIAAVAALAAPLAAQESNAPAPAPAAFQAVLDCEKLSDRDQRLACFDRTVAAMAAATRDRQIAVVDRDSIREAKRGIFGLSLPRLKIFGNGQDEEITEIDSTISNVRKAKDGMPIFVLADGAQWKQTDGRDVFAKPGHAIHIRKASLGSYVANIAKRPGVRVVRVMN